MTDKRLKKIFLIRHGQSEGNINPNLYKEIADNKIDLSKRGKEQAIEAGIILHEFIQNRDDIADTTAMRFWTSPYNRTRQTAHYIKKSFKIADCFEDLSLVEQDWGLFDGLSDEEKEARFKHEYAHTKKWAHHKGFLWARPPGGESRYDVAMRIRPFFGTLHRDAEREKNSIDTVAIVSHGVTIRAMKMQWLHYPYEWFEDEPNPPNCSIQFIEYEDGKGYVDRGYIHNSPEKNKRQGLTL